MKTLLLKKDTKQLNRKYFRLELFFLKKMVFAFLKRDFKEYTRCKESYRLTRHNRKSKTLPIKLNNGNGRVAVYTSLFGNYDSIKSIKIKNPICDYFIITDQHLPPNSGWDKKDIVFPDIVNNNNILKNRYCKMHPHLLFPNYSYSIYIDATLTIQHDILRLLTRMGDKFIGMFDHHRGTDCLYEEGQILKKIKKAPSADIETQLNRYLSEGFPVHYGFTECTIIVRDHMNQKCITLMEFWWKEFLNSVHRDQLSFMYSLWKTGLSKSEMACLGKTYWDEPIFSRDEHLS